jgi:hypothetical protein
MSGDRARNRTRNAAARTGRTEPTVAENNNLAARPSGRAARQLLRVGHILGTRALTVLAGVVVALSPACSSARANAPSALLGPSPVIVESGGELLEEAACAGSWIHAYNGPYPDMDPFTKWAYSDLGTDSYDVTWSVGPIVGAEGWASAFGYHGPKPVPGPSGYLRGASGLHVIEAHYQRQCARLTVCIPLEDGTGCDQ